MVCKRMKRLRGYPVKRAYIPVIALTSNSMPQDIEAGLGAGFDGYLTKPIKVSELMQTIEQTLDKIYRPDLKYCGDRDRLAGLISSCLPWHIRCCLRTRAHCHVNW